MTKDHTSNEILDKQFNAAYGIFVITKNEDGPNI
jgi:hypothetical protein